MSGCNRVKTGVPAAGGRFLCTFVSLLLISRVDFGMFLVISLQGRPDKVLDAPCRA
jgi:hypothetical protein